MKTVVTAAIVEKDGKYLITQRPMGKRFCGMWEFPGGRLEEGETLEECIEREIKEELGIVVRATSKFGESSASYDDGLEVNLHAYNCEYLSGEIQMIDILDYRWVKPHEMSSSQMPRADIPFVKKLKELAAKK